jgi:hypothetical protein
VTSLVFDTTALSHFARADRTDELQVAVADEPVLLAQVATELSGSRSRTLFVTSSKMYVGVARL